MDKKHKDFLLLHRSTFVRTVDVDRLIPYLQSEEILSEKDIEELQLRETSTPFETSWKAEKFLDILPTKGSRAFHALCIALESTYPQLLTIMFLGIENKLTDAINFSSVESELESRRRNREKELHATSSQQSSFGLEYELQAENGPLLKSNFELLVHDCENSHMDLHKGETQLRRLPISGDSKVPSLSALPKHGSSTPFDKDMLSASGSDKTLSSRRDYERLRAQCDAAMREVQSLRRQHGETMRKCDTAMKDADFYRKQHKLAIGKLDQQQSDAIALKSQHSEIMGEKHRLEQEVLTLQKFCEEDRKEVAELRRQQQESMNANGSNEAIIAALRKSEAIKDDYDSLRKRYADLIASHSAAASKLEFTQEEVACLKKQMDAVMQEKDGAIRERNGLKQQCTSAIRQWDIALRERNEAKEALAKVQQQRDEAMKEINQAMAVRIKATKDLARLTEERNAAVQEYSLTMSERDSVHKEIEKLHEELAVATAKIKTLETQKKISFEEVETLRREIASALNDRDKAIKQCNDLREKYEDNETSRSDSLKDREEQPKDYDYYHKDRDLTLKSRNELLELGNLTDMYNKTQKERMENLDQANQEIDRLRKQAEKLQIELNEASQEAEVSKRRRDWAFNERDKIVQERESIRTLCDKLRRERDRAVSDLAEALRDSDDIKKQRNEASKEVKELREKIEAQMEKESRIKHLNFVGHNHSRDSAIDADLQEWETETLDIEIGASNEDDLGFELAGGRDDPQFPDCAIFVSNVIKGSPADGKLRANDCICRINNIDVTNSERRTAMDTVRNSGGLISMVIRRRRLTSSRFIQSVHLNLGAGKEHGLNLETGVYISRIAPGSVAAKEGNLALGDRVVSINGRFLDGIRSGTEATKLLDVSGETVVLALLKSVNSPSAPMSSSSSGHNIQDNLDAEKSSSPKSYTVTGSPMKEHNYGGNCKEPAKKLTTSSSQTEDLMVISSPQRQKSVGDGKNLAGSPPQNFIDKFFGVDRRSTKERSKDKKLGWTSSPLQEEEAIAELDSVIDHYKKSSNSKANVKSRKKREKETEKNGGTWPKYRGPPLEFLEANQGAMTHVHRKRERVSIASLLNAPKLSAFYDSKKQMERDRDREHERERLRERREREIERERGGRDVDVDRLTGSRRSSIGSSGDRASDRERSGFHPYNSDGIGASVLPLQPNNSPLNQHPPRQFKSTGHFLSSPKSSFQTSSVRPLDGKSAGPVHYSTNSILESHLDYSVVSANRDKEKDCEWEDEDSLDLTNVAIPTEERESSKVISVENTMDPIWEEDTVLEFYKNKKTRPNSSYLPNNGDRFASPDGLVPSKPPSLDLQSLYNKPSHQPLGHLSRGELSPTDPLNFSPRLSERAVALHTRAPSHPCYSSGTAHVPSYYTVSSSRMQHNYAIVSHPHANMTSASSSSSAGVGSPSPRYSSPPTLPCMSRSGESLLGASIPETSPVPDARIYFQRYGVNPSPSPSPLHYGFSHSPSHSMDLQHFHPIPKRMVPNHPVPSYRGAELTGFVSYDGPATIPKRSHHRIRIPSNQSVTSKSSASKLSTSSIERASASERNSPMPAFHVETITPGGSIVHRSISDFHNKKPSPGELRNIRIDKNAEDTLGINIDGGPRGGIFVSSVSENSIAAQAGIYIGDQLLEVCGINMRSATYLLAANVLRQCGDSITMLVQYNPEKYHEALGMSESSSSEESPVQTPTPSSSPKVNQSPLQLLDIDDMPVSASSTLKRQNTLISSKQKDGQVGGDIYAPRYVFLKTMTTSNLGITFLGGNAVGIFVHQVQCDSPANCVNGLRCGDQILEYNGIDLKHATAEQAAYELAKRAETITVLAQYKIERYNEIQHLPGDSIYIRAMFDHQAENPNELSFRKDDILFVDNTMFNGVPGLWRAWILDEEGHKTQCGAIPSKYKVEEDLVLRRSLGELDSESGSRRSAMSARRSFFRRYRKHQRSNSRDIKELASFSDASINSFSDSGNLIEDPPILTYQRVERLTGKANKYDIYLRPVLILGPLIDIVLDKLVQDFPRKFARCISEAVDASTESMENGLQENRFVDYRRRGSHFECVTLSAIRDYCDKNCHCIIDVSPAAIERLQRNQIYPIVLFIKFKSTKQIREVKDPRLLTEKVSTKAAKEMYEHSLRLENEFKHHISAIIPGGNLAYMCAQIQAQVDQEQNKAVWVQAGAI